MNLERRTLWLGLGFAGVAILGAALWVTSPWSTKSDRHATASATPAAATEVNEMPPAAGAEISDMLKMARAAFLACGAPAAPTEVPDGATATRAQMVDAHATVKAFDEATTIYTQCVDTTAYQATVQFKAVATSADSEALTGLQTQLHNAAIDNDQTLANRFNVQLRRYKARGEK